jgi:hypothetical protein
LFGWQVPEPSHVSALSQTVSLDEPHDVPALANVSVGHAPATHVSAESHWPALPRHSVPFGSLLMAQLPAPSHVSALSQIESAPDPHDVPELVWFGWQVPLPLHVSGSSHSVSLDEPHVVPDASKASAGQLPAPSQVSATSQAPWSARHSTEVGS